MSILLLRYRNVKYVYNDWAIYITKTVYLSTPTIGGTASAQNIDDLYCDVIANIVSYR